MGDKRVEPLMEPVAQALNRAGLILGSDAWAAIYNRAYEAVMAALPAPTPAGEQEGRTVHDMTQKYGYEIEQTLCGRGLSEANRSSLKNHMLNYMQIARQDAAPSLLSENAALREENAKMQRIIDNDPALFVRQLAEGDAERLIEDRDALLEASKVMVSNWPPQRDGMDYEPIPAGLAMLRATIARVERRTP
jgi:hypothetical protein